MSGQEIQSQYFSERDCIDLPLRLFFPLRKKLTLYLVTYQDWYHNLFRALYQFIDSLFPLSKSLLLMCHVRGVTRVI